MCPFGFILGYIIFRLVINNQALRKTKITVKFLHKRGIYKYEVNLR